MSRRLFVLPVALVLFAASDNRSSAQPAAAAAGGNPFDGDWSLQMSISTAPGGVSTRLAMPFNCQYVVENRRFQVQVDGSFEWLAREAGRMHDDGVSPGPSSFQNDFQIHLRGRGMAELPPETGGAERPGDRRLNLQLSFIGGDGRGSAVNPGGSGYSIGVVSADLTQMAFTSYPGGNVVTVTTVPHEVTWSVRSTSTTREEIAPDVILERTIYEATRHGTLRALGQDIPVTERIEVKHVRYFNLVPRG